MFYETFASSYSYTRIGRIEGSAGLASALGSGHQRVTFTVR
ncbi:MAG: cyclophilin-like fold protein [Burkholderiaceae bacterium]|nr:cyclophilin-like fold protein [Burkholderiaceae bacterium]MCU0966429.1 cyclophilin-like fold protein [Burkholderiaceae bacterium]